VIPVTLLVTTRDEEQNIESCLLSACGLIEQIIVIDSESADDTVKIASRYAEVVSLPYDHTKIIPWIYQWALDNLEIRNEWVMILEADQRLTEELKAELGALFSRGHISESGFYVRRRQVFRGRPLRFGGYGSKYMLKLFRRAAGQLDAEETDTRVYVKGPVGRLSSPIVEENHKEDQILFYLQKHLRYAEVFAREEILRRRESSNWKTEPALFGTPDQRVLWIKKLYFRLPLYVRPFLYFFYRYVILLGFLDGKTGSVFHFLQAFWFRLVMDIRIEELQKAAEAASQQDDRNAGPSSILPGKVGSCPP
jgi:glycosyltransferase involved in cell wall biosynthesis